MPSFQAQHVSRTHSITLNGDPGVVFPLFTPLQEKKWSPEWECDFLHPASGDVEKNAVFLTRSHDHGTVEAVWIISQYNPGACLIEYQRIEPGVKVGSISIRCTAGEPGQTRAAVTYSYTGLDRWGNQFIQGFTETVYHQYLETWETSINHYLNTGKALDSTSC